MLFSFQSCSVAMVVLYTNTVWSTMATSHGWKLKSTAYTAHVAASKHAQLRMLQAANPRRAAEDGCAEGAI